MKKICVAVLFVLLPVLGCLWDNDPSPTPPTADSAPHDCPDVSTIDGPSNPPDAREDVAADAFVGLDASPNDADADACVSSVTWAQTTRSVAAPWYQRDGAQLIALPSGRLLLMGGWRSSNSERPLDWNGYYITNEVWASDDLGVTWFLLLPDTIDTSARFTRGHAFGAVIHTHMTDEYVYVVGSETRPTGAIWRSPVSSNGLEWSLVTLDGPTKDGRLLHMTASRSGALYVMGGQTDLSDASTALSDVYKSVDGGYTWERLADAPWAGRGAIYNVVNHDGSLYVIGGSTYHTTDQGRTHYNDVWRMNADDTWTLVLANGHSQWIGRHYHSVVSAGGRLWIIGGYNGSAAFPDERDESGNLKSIYYSSDSGYTWTRWENAAWGASHADGVTVFEGRIYRASGNVWDTATYSIEARWFCADR